MCRIVHISVATVFVGCICYCLKSMFVLLNVSPNLECPLVYISALIGETSTDDIKHWDPSTHLNNLAPTNSIMKEVHTQSWFIFCLVLLFLAGMHPVFKGK